MIRRPPRSTLDRSSAASDVYKRQLLHSASSVPFSSNIYIYPKYLNSVTCSSCSPSSITSHRGLSSLITITLLLSTFTFKPILLHTLQIFLPILSNSLQIHLTKPYYIS